MCCRRTSSPMSILRRLRLYGIVPRADLTVTIIAIDNGNSIEYSTCPAATRVTKCTSCQQHGTDKQIIRIGNNRTEHTKPSASSWICEHIYKRPRPQSRRDSAITFIKRRSGPERLKCTSGLTCFIFFEGVIGQSRPRQEWLTARHVSKWEVSVSLQLKLQA